MAEPGAFICQMGLKHSPVVGCWGWGVTGPGQEAQVVRWLSSSPGAWCSL